MPIIDEMTHDMTTVRNEAKGEVSQRMKEVETEPGYRVEEGGSRDEHGMAKADHMSRVHKADKSEDEGRVYEHNEYEPPDLKEVEMENQVCRSQQSKYNNKGGLHRLTCHQQCC